MASAQTLPTERPLVLGTAGHVDHGKTTLIKALTGVDCDRLKEEKARGITIELGFASLVTPGGRRVSVIDVPGHEKFVRTMIAGAGGVDIALLVIAADEGVKPQTIEHIAICGLLGIPRGVVAISKSDLVESTLLNARRSEIATALKDSFFESAPCVAVSANTGHGITDLVTAIEATACEAATKERERRDALPSRLAVDRVFSMAGFGVVVTGTLSTGSLAVGDEVVLLPGGGAARIRGLEVHGNRVERVESGVRVAINLQGLDKAALRRGDTIATPGAFFETQTVDVEVTHLPFADRALPQNVQLAFHLGTTNGLATLRFVGKDRLDPGQRGFAQLFLDRPMVAAGGDRFVLRGTEVLRNYGKTVGGGVIVDARAPIIRKRSRVEKDEWTHLASSRIAEKISVVAERAARVGFDEATTRMRLGITAEEWRAGIDELESAREVTRLDANRTRFVSMRVINELLSELEKALDVFHRASPTKGGESIVALMQNLHVTGSDVMSTLLQFGAREKRIELSQDRVSLPGRAEESKDATATLRGTIIAFYQKRGLSSPRVREVADALKVAAKTVDELVSQEVASGRLVRIAADFVAPLDDVKALEARLVDHLQRHGSISTQEFKELSGVTRKYAIPLAEFFDARRVTLRVGEKRIRR